MIFAKCLNLILRGLSGDFSDTSFANRPYKVFDPTSVTNISPDDE